MDAVLAGVALNGERPREMSPVPNQRVMVQIIATEHAAPLGLERLKWRTR
jgi:hypothetical protein